MSVLFIGDQPSSKNVDPTIPFVGTPSYKRLLKWIGELDLSVGLVKIINKREHVMINEYEFDVVLFLGKKSETCVGVLSHRDGHPGAATVPKFKTVDHPSPRNRKFNDPDYEKKMLKELKGWLYE